MIATITRQQLLSTIDQEELCAAQGKIERYRAYQVNLVLSTYAMQATIQVAGDLNFVRNCRAWLRYFPASLAAFNTLIGI